MNDQPRFDPTRSAAVKDMLMGVVERNTAPARPKRTAVLISLVAGAIIVAGGGAAWAVSGLSPFSAAPAPAPTSVAPTPSATRTPTATPTPTASARPADDPTRPHSTVALTCDQLGTAAQLTTVLPGAEVYNTDPYFAADLTPADASFLQSGSQECSWSSATSYLAALVATDAEAGRTDVTSQLDGGAAPLDVGDGGALACTASRCTVSLTVGSYWATVTAATDGVDQASALAQSAATAFAAALREHPQEREQWVAPASSWTVDRDCSATGTDRPITDVLGAKWLTGPYPPGASPAGYPRNFAIADPLERVETRVTDCFWASADGLSQDPSIITQLRVQIAPGAAWGYALSSAPSDFTQPTPVTVRGADEATFVCTNDETQVCFLNVLTDGAWMRLGVGDTLHPSDQAPLVAAAESLIAAHRG